jgi:riboflavin synthase
MDMFNGLIRTLGAIQEIQVKDRYRTFLIHTDAEFLKEVGIGDSIAVNGCCLSVVALQHNQFSVDVSEETLRCTTFGNYKAGQIVHLETSLRLADRIDGHLLTGHVDGVGEVVALEPVNQGMTATFAYPNALYAYIAKKGAIAIDGVSLTVNEVTAQTFTVHWIPITLEKTHFKYLRVGGKVNLEVDLTARYLVHFSQVQQEQAHEHVV